MALVMPLIWNKITENVLFMKIIHPKFKQGGRGVSKRFFDRNGAKYRVKTREMFPNNFWMKRKMNAQFKWKPKIPLVNQCLISNFCLRTQNHRVLSDEMPKIALNWRKTSHICQFSDDSVQCSSTLLSHKIPLKNQCIDIQLVSCSVQYNHSTEKYFPYDVCTWKWKFKLLYRPSFAV